MASEPRTAGEAAWRAWLIGGESLDFANLSPEDQKRWEKVGDAVIYHARKVIAEEMVKAAVAAERSLFPPCKL